MQYCTSYLIVPSRNINKMLLYGIVIQAVLETSTCNMQEFHISYTCIRCNQR